MPRTEQDFRRKAARLAVRSIARVQSLSAEDMLPHLPAPLRARLAPWLTPTRPAGIDGFDAFAPDTLRDPYTFYDTLRRKAPVYKVPGADYYCVSTYDLVREVALDTSTYSSNLVAILLASGKRGAKTWQLPSGQGPVDVLAIEDPPVHTRHRKLATAALSSRFQKSLDDDIRAMVDELLAPALARGTCEWMHDVANVVPMRIALRLVGFPEEDHRRVKFLCDHAVALLSGVNTPAQLAEHVDFGIELFAYVQREFQRHVRAPQDNLTGSLVQAIHAQGDDALSEAEALSILLQILIAGSDSSASALGSCVARLAREPELQARLRRDPDGIPAFVEEMLRLEAPFQGHFRVTTRPVSLGGVSLPKGARLMLLWASANRDAARFEEPTELRTDRPGLRQHMTFGYGAHLCLGAHLARREIQIALAQLLAQTEAFGPGVGGAAHRPSVFTRTLTQLPLQLTPASAAAAS
ncbi:MAG: cytochrome P450 [Sandaracinaceae bacterium]|nr:cytochrome P450 [Sandaracinaceae bacterium]